MTNKSVHSRESNPSHVLPVLDRGGRPFVGVVLLFLLLQIVGCSRQAVRFAESGSFPEGPVIILGDSLAAGHDLKIEQAFPFLLSQRLGIEIVNLGLSGATTAASLPRITEEVLPLQPSLVILQLGGNDALQKMEPQTTKANLQAMIDRLHEAKVPVMILAVRGGVLSDKYATLFVELARVNQLGYVSDILDGLLTNPNLRLDHVHPNAAGHKMIADKVEPELKRVLKKIGKLQ